MNWEAAYVGRTEHPIDEAANVLINDKFVARIGHQTNRFGNFSKSNLGEFLGLMKCTFCYGQGYATKVMFHF